MNYVDPSLGELIAPPMQGGSLSNGRYQATGAFDESVVIYLRQRGSLALPVSTRVDVKREFIELAQKWEEDTVHISSLSDKYLHPSYARIIGLGPSVVPLILRTIRDEPGDWFYALRALTGDDPVTPDMAGDLPAMTETWLHWADAKGISY